MQRILHVLMITSEVGEVGCKCKSQLLTVWRPTFPFLSSPLVERKMASTVLLHAKIKSFVDLVQYGGFAVQRADKHIG